MSGGWSFSQEESNCAASGFSSAASVPVSLTISTTANNVKNTYTQITAATTSDIQLLDVVLGNATLPINTNVYTDIAVGTGGSEVIIANNLTVGGGVGTFPGARFTLPVNIPSGTRVAARFALSSSTTTTTTTTPSFMFHGYDGGFPMQTGFAGVDAVGQTNGVGTVLATPAGANTKSAYAPLTAATTQDYAGFLLGFDTQTGNNLRYLIDLAIGAGGSEVNIVPNYFYLGANTAGPSNIGGSRPIMISIPKGTRIAARAQSSTSLAKINLTFYGIYA